MATRPPARIRSRLAGTVILLVGWLGSSALADTCLDARSPSGDWRFGASDLSRGWSRAEWVERDGPIHSVELRGIVLSRAQGVWTPCLDPTIHLELTIHGDNQGRPGDLRLRQEFQLALTDGDSLYGGLATDLTLALPVDPGLDLRSGWVGVRSLGEGGCFWLWAAADGGDGVSALDRGAGWEVAPFDLALCVRGLRLDAPKVVLRRVGDSLQLTWKPVDGAASYQVWMNAADGLGFQPVGAPGSQTTWSRPLDSLAAMSNFRVTSLSP